MQVIGRRPDSGPYPDARPPLLPCPATDFGPRTSDVGRKGLPARIPRRRNPAQLSRSAGLSNRLRSCVVTEGSPGMW